MNKFAHIALAFLAAFLLTASQPEAPAPQATTNQQNAPVAAANTIAPVTSPLLSIAPANMTASDPAAVATAKWDVRRAHPEPSTISIWAGTSPDAKLFVTGATNGETQTGPWVRSGSQFQLKDQATDKALGQITVGGPKWC